MLADVDSVSARKDSTLADMDSILAKAAMKICMLTDMDSILAKTDSMLADMDSILAAQHWSTQRKENRAFKRDAPAQGRPGRDPKRKYHCKNYCWCALLAEILCRVLLPNNALKSLENHERSQRKPHYMLNKTVRAFKRDAPPKGDEGEAPSANLIAKKQILCRLYVGVAFCLSALF